MTDCSDYLFLLDGLRPNQREAVLSTKPSVVVTAGAGTGKTRTLAARFAWLVTCRGLDVTEILTLTFTEKAAQEMADRIASTLRQWGQALGDTGRADEALRLGEAAARIGEAPISTIHSFAHDLVRRNALHLNLPPGTGLPAPPDEEAFWKAVGEGLDGIDKDWFLSRLGPERKDLAAVLDEPAMETVLARYRPEELIALARSASALFGSRAGRPEDLPGNDEKLKALDERAREEYRRRRLPFWREACSWWSGALDAIAPDERAKNKAEPLFAAMKASWTEPGEEGLAEAVGTLTAFLKEAAGSNSAKVYRTAQSVIEERSQGRFRRLVALRETLEDKGALEALLLASDGEGAAADRDGRALLLKLTSLLWALWEEEKRRRGLFDFDDMIRLGRDTLRRHPEGSPAYRAIVVDEYQDTDVVQEELISAAVEASRRRGECSLFIVGDLKQSIYRFRHAEPDLFASHIMRAREDRTSSSSCHSLSESFRSRSAHLNVVNDLFGHLWSRGLTARSPLPYEDLDCPDDLPWWETRDGATETRTLTLLMETDEKTRGGEEGDNDGWDEVPRRRLARALALALEGMKGKPLWDGGLGAARPATWRDMAVLVPTRSAYGLLEEVLCGERGLPAVFLGRKAFFSRGEVRDAVALLRSLADGDDDVALAGWLASPFSGLALERATALADEALERKVPLRTVLAEREGATAQELLRLRRRALLLGPARLLEELTAQAAPFMILPPYLRRRALANLRRAVDLAREYETSRGRSLWGCADYMARGDRGPGSLEEAPVLGEREDVIRVMTVHAAKGLEFPIVALTGLDRAPSAGRGERLTPSRFVGVLAGSDGESPPSRALHNALEREDLAEENRRLFYVAATRAQESLLLCGLLPARKKSGEAPSLPEGSWLADVGSWLTKEGDSSPEGRYEALCRWPLPDEARSFGERTSQAAERKPRRKGTKAPEAKPCLAWAGASAFALYSFCPYAYRLRYRLEMPLHWDGEALSDDETVERTWPSAPKAQGRLPWRASDWGSLVHHLLGRVWDLTPEGLARALPPAGSPRSARIEADLPLFLHPLWQDGPTRQRLAEDLGKLASTETCRRLADLLARGRLERERFFRVDLDGGPSLRGAMDLLWEEAEGIELRDFKTGEPSPAGDILYERQLAFYALALEIQRGKPVRAALIGLDGQERFFALPDRTEREEALRAFARSAVAGPFLPRHDRCRECPWQEGCPGKRKE